MSATGPRSASRVDTITVTAPADDADSAAASAPAASATSTAATVTRGGDAAAGRLGVLAGIGAGGSGSAAGSLPDLAVALGATGAGIAKDGSIVAVGPEPAGGILGLLNQLALRAPDAAGPFDAVTDKALLRKVVAKLAEQHEALAGKAPDDATTLAWRQSRGACLHLMEEASLRAGALGDKRLAGALAGELAERAQHEPWRQLRDFAFESLTARAETKALPEVAAAREAVYPSAPPYDKWLADGKIDMVIYVDDSGSMIADQIDFLKSQGFKHTANSDGSHTFKMAKRGEQPAIEVTIPKKDGEPALFEKMGDASVDVIGYMGHAGYGHRVDHALAQGVSGTGADKLVFLMQCWGEGNVESLERAYPDAQMLSTTAPTTDNMDWVLLSRMFEGFRGRTGWDPISKKAIADLKREFKDDGEHDAAHWDGHYFFPTTRSTLVKHYDRDGDGTKDGDDHIFNVVYPKRVDAAGGFDPVVQSIPVYALDGTALNKAVNDLTLSIRYNHLLGAREERKIPWDPNQWRSGGFFEPADGDLRAFRFTKGADGAVSVALSTRFAHTQPEELSKMLAYEAGLWLGKEAGRDPLGQVALGVGLLERVVHQQGTWYATESGMLDESWAEEALFMRRYGLAGFTFAALEHEVGDPDEYKPEHFAKVAALVRDLPGVAALADRPPTPVGEPVKLTRELRFANSYIDEAELGQRLEELGIRGSVRSIQPTYLEQGQATNVAVVLERDGKLEVLSLGIDSEGLVQSAARLDLDLAKKTDATAGRMLDALAASGGLPAADAQAAYARRRAAGEGFAAALAGAVADLRPRMPPGTGGPDIGELWGLQQAGFASDEDSALIQAAVSRHYPENDAAEAEKKLFRWVGDVAKRKRLDLPQLHATYHRELLAGGGGAEGRNRAIDAVLKALPRDAGPPETGLAAAEVLQALGTSQLLALPSRQATVDAVIAKMGLDRTDLAVQAFELDVAADMPGRAEGSAALRRALDAGKPLAEAVAAAVTELKRKDLDVWVSPGSFAVLGLAPEGTPDAAALQGAVNAVHQRFSSAAQLCRWAAEIDGRRDAKAFGEALWRSLDADPAGGMDAALRAVIASLPRAKLKEAGVQGLLPVIESLPAADRSAVLANVLDAAGMTKAAAARSLLTEDSLSIGPEAGTGGQLKAVHEAFDAKVRAGGSVAEGYLAAAEVLLASGSTDGAGRLGGYLASFGLASAAERAAVQPGFADLGKRVEAEETIAVIVSSSGLPAARQKALLDGHRDRLARGTPYGDELVRFLRALPRLDRDQVYLDLSTIAGLARLMPAGRGAEVVEAIAASQRLDVGVLAWEAMAGQIYDEAQAARGRAAYDAARAAGKPLSECMADGVKALGPDEPSATDYVDAGLHGLVDAGLATEAEAIRARESVRLAAGVTTRTLCDLAAVVSGAPVTAAVTRRIERRMAEAGATTKDGVEAMLAALGNRPAGAPPSTRTVHVAEVLRDLQPEDRAKAAAAIYARMGTTPEREVRSYLVEHVAARNAGDMGAIVDAAAAGGPRAAIEAALRQADLYSLRPEVVTHAAELGLIADADRAPLLAVLEDTRLGRTER